MQVKSLKGKAHYCTGLSWCPKHTSLQRIVLLVQFGASIFVTRGSTGLNYPIVAEAGGDVTDQPWWRRGYSSSWTTGVGGCPYRYCYHWWAPMDRSCHGDDWPDGWAVVLWTPTGQGLTCWSLKVYSAENCCVIICLCLCNFAFWPMFFVIWCIN